MNEIVLRLARQTAILLESTILKEQELVQAGAVLRYFEKLGALAEDSIENNTTTKVSDGFDELCTRINNTLSDSQKVYLLLLVQDSLLSTPDSADLENKLRGIFTGIGIDVSLMKKFREFLELDDIHSVNSSEYLLLSPQDAGNTELLEGRWIEDNVSQGRTVSGEFTLTQIDRHLIVMFVSQIRAYIVRCIDRAGILYDGDIDQLCRFRLLKPGNELIINGVSVISFSELKSRFQHITEKKELTLTIDQLEYSNWKGEKEIYSFSANETTGRLIGIVGREGVGKSTLLKLLAGKFKPGSGNIFVNGYDLWKNKYLLKGVIGFVPEEDLLFGELTVADNLTLTAQLFYSHLTRKEIDARVNALLSRIDLLDLKHVVVGSIDNKYIQPGQRRLINIALELLREPQILLVDNALSGLGMSDAARVIRVLHDYSFAGNLVVTSISQVDSDTFMLFDKIWILDAGGYPIYNGSVKAAPGYIFRNLKLTYQEKEKTDPASLLDWVNYRLPDKEGHVWKRVHEPQEWHQEYLRDQVLQNSGTVSGKLLPARILKTPNLEIQLLIFSIRNFKCKFSRIREIIKALLIAPFVAFFIALLLRTGNNGGYTLLANVNLPVYQFLSVVVAIFLGLLASVDEIIRERNVLEKEEYQEFSRFSYLNSKILYLLPVIAIQSLLYVLAGNLILGIREMFWVYWSVLFSSACFGALLGLVFSSGVQSRSFLYKGVLPFIIGVQVLLGGGVIPYDRLNLGSFKYSPLIGDLMVSRWGYEALAVEQFKNNSFEKLTYKMDKKLDQAAFYAFQGVPKMEQTLNRCINTAGADSARDYATLLQNELTRVAEITDVFRFEYLNSIAVIRQNPEIASEASDYITYLSLHFYEQYQALTREKSLLMGHLADSIGVAKLASLRQNYHNLKLEETVTNSAEDKPFHIIDNQMIQNTGMIFQEPRSNWGRAVFFSPVKIFNDKKTETLWFNISMIWLLAAVCYIWVLFDITGLIRNALRVERNAK